MTQPLDLDSIEARANAATPGPWDRYPQYGAHFYANTTGEHLTGIGDLNFGDGEQADADEAFVRHAREDVDALLAEVHRLRAEVATLAEARRLEWVTSHGQTPHTPRLCECGHSHLAHTVPAPHSCFAYGQTCPCRAYRQLPHDEAVAQLKRNHQVAAAAAAVPAVPTTTKDGTQ
jgi:hypothetical protein